MWLTSMRHRLLLKRGWGKMGGSRRLLDSRVSRKWGCTTSGKLSASLRDSHTAVILIKASKVKEMYTCEISKGNTSYLKLNKVSRYVSKRHRIPPWYATCGWCRHVDSVEGRTLEIQNILYMANLWDVTVWPALYNIFSMFQVVLSQRYQIKNLL